MKTKTLFRINNPLLLLITTTVAIGGFLYGYDLGVISGALFFISDSIKLSQTQTELIVGMVFAGSLVGTLIAGSLADRYGRKISISIASVIFMVGILFMVTATNFWLLLAGRLFLGIGIGFVSVVVPLFITELAPAETRGRSVTLFQLFLSFGLVISYLVDLLLSDSGNWRFMFGFMFLPTILLLWGSLRLPESPRWLISKKQDGAASDILQKINKKDWKNEFELIKKSLIKQDASFFELFSLRYVLITVVACAIAICNQLVGISTFFQYAPMILKIAGINSTSNAMLASLCISIINFICTLIGFSLIDKVGRRPLLLFGLVGVIFAEIGLGVVLMLPLTAHLSALLTMVGLIIFICSFAIGPGVVVYLAMSELFPTQLRGKGLALCFFVNSLATVALASSFLHLIDVVHLSGVFFICGFFAICYFGVAYKFLPETKEKILEEITI